MKKIRILIIGVVMLLPGVVYSQDSTAIRLADHIAGKMKDSLSLTNDQRNQVYNINMYIHNQKTSARQLYANPDTLRYRMQRIENERDSLYRGVIPDSTFLIYRQKKRFLISAN
ncbi:MAG TPA: hypothetical protein VLJ68_07240 [Chitinophagaceae bacterium]|nr:hypothetical protein [Chitinophagaceae bacterium]